MTRMLKGVLEILSGIYNKYGDLPIVGENYEGNHGELYISTIVDHNGVTQTIVLDIEQDKEYDDD